MEKKRMDLQQVLEVCYIVFEKNADPKALKAFQEKVLPADIKAECQDLNGLGKTVDKIFVDKIFCDEWYAFLFAGIYHALARFAPAYMVLEYVRSIKYMLKNWNYSDEDIQQFLDKSLQAFLQVIIEEKVKECPKLFYQRVLGRNIQDIDRQAVVILSGAMAMFVASCTDIFEKYEYVIE